MISKLPDKELSLNGNVSKAFIHVGCATFHEACLLVKDLPYGRTSDKKSLLSVLNEQKGTCSTKHALLKALANEQGLKIQLTIGFYPMRETNTPGVGDILNKHNLDSIPEAHCYLRYNKERIDLTGIAAAEESPFSELLLEVDIEPDQIGEFKQSLHRDFISKKYGKKCLSEIWKVRESCIHALSS